MATDARDARLMQEGRFDDLVAAYLHVIRQRCLVRLRDPYDADDVASDIVIRLLRQLRSGRRFSVPFRVVVHKRIEWSVKDFFAESKRRRMLDRLMERDHEPLAEDDDLLQFLDHDEVVRLIDRLTGRDREILELVHVEDLSIAEAAQRLGIERNTADQRLYRARKRLKEILDG
jgi:RNA polymerase sigma-70 factor, ECF subfamily